MLKINIRSCPNIHVNMMIRVMMLFVYVLLMLYTLLISMLCFSISIDTKDTRMFLWFLLYVM